MKKGLEIVPVSTVDEVLARALVKPLVAIEWPNDLEVPAASGRRRRSPRPLTGPRDKRLNEKRLNEARSNPGLRRFRAFPCYLCRLSPSFLQNMVSALTRFSARPYIPAAGSLGVCL